MSADHELLGGRPVPRRPDPTIKPAIVARVARHLRSTPVEALTLRGVGRVLGTSAYPVAYHFGSRQALVDAVVEHLEGADVPSLAPDADAAALTRWFATQYGPLDDPDRALAARLVFELGATERLRQARRYAVHHERQVSAVVQWCRAHDVPDAARRGREAVLHARGVQWGCVLDGDTAAADAALRTVAAGLLGAARDESAPERRGGRPGRDGLHGGAAHGTGDGPGPEVGEVRA